MLPRIYSLPLLALQAAAQVDYAQYVNPFIGGEGPFPGLAYGGGDIFVGGARPFGVAKVGIDTYETNIFVSTLNADNVLADAAPKFTHKGFKGFPSPQLSTGEFNLTDYNPTTCGVCSWPSITYEGTPFEYAFTIPHALGTLVELMGGPDEFERRLDYIFVASTSETTLGANGAAVNTIMNIGNEPDFATPFEYHYLNKQAKSVQRSRELANEYFKNDLYGVPGNSDAGALNSWILWQMLGLYPVATQPVYLLLSPWFEDMNMTINGNNTLRITATNSDNADSYYVQSVKINGKAWNKNWVEHADVMVDGGTIEFVIGSNMTRWDSGAVPPSPGHAGVAVDRMK